MKSFDNLMAWFKAWAEAVEHDPVLDHERRIAALERERLDAGTPPVERAGKAAISGRNDRLNG